MFACHRCGACCVLPAIAESYAGHPDGKPAGVRCANLTDENLCGIYDERPAACRDFAPAESLCGSSRAEAELRLGVVLRVYQELGTNLSAPLGVG
jgi:hypothetical protein